MMAPLTAVADRWVSRRAVPDTSAISAVAGLRAAVVVTGGSRGIGKAIAARFAEYGRDVVLVARDPLGLEAAAADLRTSAKGSVSTLVLDVTRPDAGREIEHALERDSRYLDVLVNNAAIGLGGPFAEHAPDAIDALVALNVAAVTRLTRHALPPMLARGRGGILNIASLGGYVPGPYQAAYYASKAYVVSLTEAIAAECAGTGVRIMVVAPGPVETRFHADMGSDTARYRWLVPAMSAEGVARAAYTGFALGRRVVRPGLAGPLGVLVGTLPHAITVPIVGWLLDNRATGDQSSTRR